MQGATFLADSAERHVNVWMFGVVVHSRHPLERRSEIPFHTRQ